MPLQESSYRQIVKALNRGDALGYREIEARFEIGQKQAKRLVDRAVAHGVPIRDRRVGRRIVYFIEEADRVTGVQVALTEDEMFALVVGAEAVQSSLGGTTLGSALKMSIRKLTDAMETDLLLADPDDATEQWHFNATPTAQLDSEILDTIRQGIVECRTLRVSYRSTGSSGLSERSMDPYAFAVINGSWLLVAWCHRHLAFRRFAVPSILEATTEEPFLRKDEYSVNNAFSGQFGAVGGDKIHHIVLRPTPECRPAFDRKRYHHSQRIEDLADGTARVHFDVAGLEDIRAWVLSWGARLIVESPEELRSMVAEDLAEGAEWYAVERG